MKYPFAPRRPVLLHRDGARTTNPAFTLRYGTTCNGRSANRQCIDLHPARNRRGDTPTLHPDTAQPSARTQFIRPPYLRPGDTVGIVTPARKLSEKADTAKSARTLRIVGTEG